MENTKVWTKEEIRKKIQSSDKWLTRGVIAIYQWQTEDERTNEETNQSNGVGFNGSDAFILSRFAVYAMNHGKLVGKQIPLARKKMLKYSGQLARIANSKQSMAT